MNFFKLYIGDYQRDTAHLSVTEHGAFLLMLQHYYATEKPLPIGKALHRMLRAQDRTEREAIDVVSTQFWRETPDGLVNDRADAEITKAHAQADTNARIAREREDRRKAARKPDEQSTNRATNDQPNHSHNHSQTPSELNTSEASPPHPPAAPSGPADAAAPSAPPDLPDCPHAELQALYAKHLPELAQPRVWDGTRQEAMRARWRQCAKPSAFGSGYRTREDGLAFWDKFFAHVAATPKLAKGIPYPDGRRWEPDLPWLIKAENFAKVIEGKYTA